MANKFKTALGQKGNAKSPSGIENSEHHDMSWSKKTSDVVPGAVESITADTVEHATKPGQLVRFTNTAAAVAFVWVGEAGTSPTPAIGNALAIPPNSAIMIPMPCLVNEKSPAYKCSAGTVQAAVFEM